MDNCSDATGSRAEGLRHPTQGEDVSQGLTTPQIAAITKLLAKIHTHNFMSYLNGKFECNASADNIKISLI